MAKLLKDSADQGRSYQFIVEKRTALGSRNRLFYTQISWKFPN